MQSDPGYFGPQSMMWRVNKEITVLFGGARALLMHAAHPLIAAGARQTSFYQRDPWKRLIRTLSLQNSVTFGTKDEADESAHRINKLHEVIKGEDEVTGGYYDALDHEQLLWVHACLQISSIYFYEKTVKKLTEDEKEIFLTFSEVNQLELVRQAAIRQKYIDQTQSLNLSFDPTDSPKWINQCHIEAWKLGVKTLYYLRTDSVIKGDLGSRTAECISCDG